MTTRSFPVRMAMLLTFVLGCSATVSAGGELPSGGHRSAKRRNVRVAQVTPPPCGCRVNCSPSYPTCADLPSEEGNRWFKRIHFPDIELPAWLGFEPVARFEGGKALGIGYDEVGAGASYRGYETDNLIQDEPELTGRYNKSYLLDRNSGNLYADPQYLAALRAQARWNKRHGR